VNITVNGEPREVAAGATLAELLAGWLSGDGRGCAAAVDSEVVPRDTWAGLVLRDGQAVEVLTAVQGG
jgi:sulfur carrier protein